MDIKELQAKRSRLSKEIENLCIEFEKETGASIRSIDLYSQVFGYDRLPTAVSVDVKVEV